MPRNNPPIQNLADLVREIEQLKEQVSKQEKELANMAGKVPGQLFKQASGAIVPAILNTATLSGAWNILKLVPVAQSLFSLFKKKKG
jgi:hypothetical protein